MYVESVTKKGITQYRKDGNLISRAEFEASAPVHNPEQETVAQVEASEPQLEADKPKRVCIFTGEPATRQRLINGQLVWLSEEMYNTKTTGEIVQHLREGAKSG